jgi:hypothetical protein
MAILLSLNSSPTYTSTSHDKNLATIPQKRSKVKIVKSLAKKNLMTVSKTHALQIVLILKQLY